MASKKRKAKRFSLFTEPDRKKTEPEVRRETDEEEDYSLNSILAEFRANRDAEREADGVTPVTDEHDAEFESLFRTPETESDETGSPFDVAGTYRSLEEAADSLFGVDDDAGSVETRGLFDDAGSVGTRSPFDDAESVGTRGPSDGARRGKRRGPLSGDAESVETRGLFDDAESVGTRSPFDDAERGRRRGPLSDDAESVETRGPSDDAGSVGTRGPSDDAESVGTRGPSDDAESGKTHRLFGGAKRVERRGPSDGAESGKTRRLFGGAKRGKRRGPFGADAERVETRGPSDDRGLFDDDAGSVETYGLFGADAKKSGKTRRPFGDDARETDKTYGIFDDDDAERVGTYGYAPENVETYSPSDDEDLERVETYGPFDDDDMTESVGTYGYPPENVDAYGPFDDDDIIAETPVAGSAEAVDGPETPVTEAEAVADAPSGGAEALDDGFMDAEEPEEEPKPSFWRRLFRRKKPQKAVEEPEPDAPPKSIPLGEVVGHTVDAVKADELLKKQGWSRRSLFSRRRMEDDEDVLSGPEIIGPEPSLKTAADQSRREYVKRTEGLMPALVPVALPLLTLIAEAFGLRLPLLSGSVILRPLLLLGCLGATLWFCRSAFKDHRCTASFLCGVSAAAACLDCITAPWIPGRSMAEPYGAVVCLSLLIAKWGASLESDGNYSAFRVASMDRNPPYLVTDTVSGACKQRGAVTGFYTAMQSQNFSTRWQTLFLPVTLAASLVFAALSSIGQDRGGDFFVNWSAILTAGTTLSLPLCWGLPWARLSARLKKAGCALAGWRGAEQIARKKKMIVTDADLFPPGSVQMEDVRVYGIERKDAASLAASMIRDSGCGLERIFDDFLASEAGEYVPIRDFQFYEDGGFSGVVDENLILVGTSSFLRKMSVRFPGDFYFPMGVYLAVDGALAATFALKYEAVENVDFALRMMRRNRVTAILAARDPNLTPKLLQRVFHRRVDVEYPGLNNRLSLSVMQSGGDMPRGLLFREGLAPYAELVVGSMRLCGGVRWSTRLALLSSAVGTLLSFYLVFQAKYYLLTPLNLLLFLLLWTAPVVLLMDLS